MERLTRGEEPKRRLKKQPKRQAFHATAGAMPRIAMPQDTTRAAKRRRRSQRRGRLETPLLTLRRVVTSARWISLGLLSLSVYALVFIGSSPEFYLTLIPVEGVFSIAPEEIVASSGLAGKHIFAADPNAAAAAIADTPGIISAAVSLEWPNRVSIAIEEDSPIAIWEQGTDAYWINADGDLIPARINVPGLIRVQTDAPHVVLGLVSAAAPEEAADTADAQPTAAPPHHTLGKVPRDILEGALLLHKLRPETQVYVYHPSNGLSFQDSRGWEVFLGTGLDMEQKLAVYEAMVQTIQAEGLTPQYISVSNQAKPFYLANAAP